MITTTYYRMLHVTIRQLSMAKHNTCMYKIIQYYIFNNKLYYSKFFSVEQVKNQQNGNPQIKLK